MPRDDARLCACLSSPALKQAFDEQGFAVVDDFFGAAWATALRSELVRLKAGGHLHENKIQFGAHTFVKPGIFEADCHDASVVARVPEIAHVFELAQSKVVDALSKQFPALGLVGGKDGVVLKLQYNAGGGACVPLHYDNAGPPSKRALSCLVYLNPAWKPEDGGELELVPFLGGPRPACDGTASSGRGGSSKAPVRAPIVIEPRMDRLVVFASDRVLHRVKPSFACERYLFTMWLDGTGVNKPEDTGLRAKHLALPRGRLAATLRASPLQRALSRAVYASEYEDSLRECFFDAEPPPLALEAAAPAVRDGAAGGSGGGGSGGSNSVKVSGGDTGSGGLVGGGRDAPKSCAGISSGTQAAAAAAAPPKVPHLGYRVMLAAHRQRVAALTGHAGVGALVRDLCKMRREMSASTTGVTGHVVRQLSDMKIKNNK